MLTRRIGSWAGLCAIGLLAACAPSSDKTSASESAETNNEATPDVKGRISGIDKICSVGGQADISILGGKYAVYSSCGMPDVPGQGVLLDLDDPDFSMNIGKDREVHRVRFSEGDGAFIYYASIDRTAGPASIQVHVRSADGSIEKDIAFFDAEIADSPDLLAQRLQSFDVKFSPDGKTAIVYGYEKTVDGFAGRIVVAPLDGEGQTLLTPDYGISPDADVTFSPTGDRVLILSTMSDKAPAKNKAPRQHVYDVMLGATPTLAQSPAWIFDGHVGEVTVVPGSFDGKQALRFDTDPKSETKAGLVSIVGVDGSHVELSKDAAVSSHAWVYETDAQMKDLDRRAALRLVKSGETAGYMFPGIAAGSTSVSLFLTDGVNRVEVAKDVATDGAGFARAYGGIVMYTAATGIATIDLNGTQPPQIIAKDSDTKIYMPINVSFDGKAAIVQGVTDTAVTYETIDLVTAKTTELELPVTNGDCGYDLSQVQMYKGIVTAFGALGTGTAECKAHEKGVPEMLGFAADGTGKSVAFALVDPAASEPTLDLSAFDHGVVTQCSLDGASCSAFIEIPPAVEALITPPDTKGDGKTDPGTDKPVKPTKPTKPAPTTGDDDDDTVDAPDEGAVVVTKRPPTTNGATTSETPVPGAPTTKTISSASCSSAPGGAGSAGFGAAFLLGLAVLGRRRRR